MDEGSPTDPSEIRSRLERASADLIRRGHELVAESSSAMDAAEALVDRIEATLRRVRQVLEP